MELDIALRKSDMVISMKGMTNMTDPNIIKKSEEIVYPLSEMRKPPNTNGTKSYLAAESNNSSIASLSGSLCSVMFYLLSK